MVAENGHAETPPMIYRRLGSTGLKVRLLAHWQIIARSTRSCAAGMHFRLRNF